MVTKKTVLIAVVLFITCIVAKSAETVQLERLLYNNPGLAVDLGVGLWAWPVPCDVNGDGYPDLIVNCDDKPYNGVYVFMNPGTGDITGDMFPVLEAGQRISKGMVNVQPSYVDGKLRLLTPGNEYPDFLNTGLENPVPLGLPGNIHSNNIRGNMWRYVDFNGDDKLDLTIGVDDWFDYGWDNAYDADGNWTNGPLHGLIYIVLNKGTNEKPEYETPFLLNDANGKPLETFGWPCQNFADWDNDGDLDILCGEFRDSFTYFENIGTRTEPKYAEGRALLQENGLPLVMDLQMITPVAYDWNGDGYLDLICGDEDGRVAFLENKKTFQNGMPQFELPRYFQQKAHEIKCGALATPVGCDWDGDGDFDIISGNTAGYILFYENLSGKGVEQPKWAAPEYLKADGKTIRIQAGHNGSIQGPAESKWGYTTLTVADWDHDGLLDLLVNSIWGKVVWYKNIGTANAPKLAEVAPIEVEWDGGQPHLAWGWLRPNGKELLTQWRTTPVAFDWNRDGLTDLLMLDHEGYFCFFERIKTGGAEKLLPPKRIFMDTTTNEPIRLNDKMAGGSGRRKITVLDYDNDGVVDFLANSGNADFWRQVKQENGLWYFENLGLIDERPISGHSTSPTWVDFNNDGIPDPLIGAEDGYFYYKRNDKVR